MSEIEYDQSGKPNSLFQVGADILNFLLLYAYLMFFFLSIINAGISECSVFISIF